MFCRGSLSAGVLMELLKTKNGHDRFALLSRAGLAVIDEMISEGMAEGKVFNITSRQAARLFERACKKAEIE